MQTQGHGTVALVPTMGALHEGHLALVRAAKRICNTVVVSIFVNPLQFGPNEDFDRYPRMLKEDVTSLEREGVGIVFAPRVDDIYPQGSANTFVEVGGVGERLDGKSRPGHFRGVATIVAKLFHIVGPDVALFGQKDAAQVAVLKSMVRDLNFSLKLVVCPTVRENDGLALSSRNRYLTAQERAQATALYRSLCAARDAAKRGVADPAELRRTMLQIVEEQPSVAVEYAEVVDPNTLLPVHDLAAGALLAIAAHVGKTRLIDNLLIENLSLENVSLDLPLSPSSAGEASCES